MSNPQKDRETHLRETGPTVTSQGLIMWDSDLGVESSDSEDEEEIQFQILEKERDEANQKLFEIEHVSQQLLNEIDALEIQFQVERSCRENAEAFAVKLTKENKVLKRKSQALLPILELPENLNLNCNLDPEVDADPDLDTSADHVIQYQDKIREVQSSLDQLLEEKIQMLEQMEALKRENVELKEQLVVEIEEKESILRKLNKQDRAVKKMKRVSQLVTQEFNDISQRLELEQGLRQHAEVFAHQVLVQQQGVQKQGTETVPSTETVQSSEMGPQLQQALTQVAQITRILEDIQLRYQNQSQAAAKEGNTKAELQNILEQLASSEAERRALEAQLRDAQSTVAKLQEEVRHLEEKRKEAVASPQAATEKEQVSSPGPPPPPPLPPPPASSQSNVDPLDALRNRRKSSTRNKEVKPSGSLSTQDKKARAVDEMMERIKKGIVLRPTQKSQCGSEDDSAWTVERNEKRKSAVQELQGMLNTLTTRSPWRGASRKRISYQVGDAELQSVLLRRRKAMGDEQEQATLGPTQDQKSASLANSSLPWGRETGNGPVLRRLKQNRENRNSRVRASGCVIWENS